MKWQGKMECGCRCIRADCKWGAAVWHGSCELQVTWALWHPCSARCFHAGNLLKPWMLQVRWSSRKFPSACLPSLTWCAYLLWLENSRAGGEGGGFGGGERCDLGEQQRAQIGQPGREGAQLPLGVPGVLPVPCSPGTAAGARGPWRPPLLRLGLGLAGAASSGHLRLPRGRSWNLSAATELVQRFISFFPQALQIWQCVAESGSSFCWCSRFWLWNREQLFDDLWLYQVPEKRNNFWEDLGPGEDKLGKVFF